jgi:hypothetical protein
MLIPRRHPELDCVCSDDPFVIEMRDARDELRADASTPDRREGVLADMNLLWRPARPLSWPTRPRQMARFRLHNRTA